MIYRLFLVLALLLATSPAHAGYFGPAVASVTPTAPNAPTSVSASVASATSVTITWTNSTIGYPAPTYDLYRGTSSGTETLWQSSVTSPYTATGLTTDQIYWFYLKATNSAGTSAASNEVSVTPSAAITAPGAPTGVTATAGNAQATVTFSAPASNGGSAITGYTVTSSPAGGTDSNAGSTSLSHVVTGLTNGTAYTFTVTATNSAGTSAASSASNSVTPSAASPSIFADYSFESNNFQTDPALGWVKPSPKGASVGVVSTTMVTTQATAGTYSLRMNVDWNSTGYAEGGVAQTVSSSLDQLSAFNFKMRISSAESTSKATIPYNNNAYCGAYLLIEEVKDGSGNNLIAAAQADGFKPRIALWGYDPGQSWSANIDKSILTDLTFDQWYTKSKDMKAYITSILDSGKTWVNVASVKLRLVTYANAVGDKFTVYYDEFKTQ